MYLYQIFSLIGLLLISIFVHADTSKIFQPKFTHSYEISEVQILKPKIHLSPDEFVDLTFTEWIAIDGTDYPKSELTDNSIGLSNSGHVYHFVELENRNYARRLSGNLCVSEIELVESSQLLLARDCENQIWYFSTDKWQKNPIPKMLLHRGIESTLYGALTYLTIINLVEMQASEFSIDLQNLMQYMLNGLGLSSISIIQVTKFLMDLESYNRTPNGFVKSAVNANFLGELENSDIDTLLRSTKSQHNDWQVNCATLLEFSLEKEFLRSEL